MNHLHTFAKLTIAQPECNTSDMDTPSEMLDYTLTEMGWLEESGIHCDMMTLWEPPINLNVMVDNVDDRHEIAITVNDQITSVTEYSEEHGLRLLVYNNTDLDAEPDIINLNQYLK